MYHTTWMKPPVAGMTNEPCVMNPLNCTNGISFSVWEQLLYDANVIRGTTNTNKRYIISTGGDFDPVAGSPGQG